VPHDIARMLTHTATVMRNVRGRDSGGGRGMKAVVMATGVPCRAGGLAMQSIYLQDGSLQSDTSRSVYFEPGTDVLIADILHLYDDADAYMGGVYVEATEPGPVYLKTRGRESQPSVPNLPPPP
jgi:hypothetical protein